MIRGYRCAGLVWFRILGYGLHAKDVTRHRLLFSERYGHSRGLRVGKWFVKLLGRGRNERNGKA